MKLSFPIGSTLIAFVAGFATAWFVKPEIAVLMSRGLSKEKAQAAILASYSKIEDPKMKCRVLNVDTTTPDSLVFDVYTDLTQACFSELEKDALVSRGECLDTKCASGCCKWAIKPGAKATVTKENGVTFACGSFEVGEIKSITTDSKEATVHFTRQFVADAAIFVSLEKCSVQRPRQSTEETWKLKRDDAGNWQGSGSDTR